MVSMTEVELVKRLDERTFTYFNAEATRRQKGAGIAYVLWFILGWAGAHKFYMGKRGWGIAYLTATGLIWLAIVSLISATAREHASALDGFFFVLAGASMLFLGAAWFVDLFTIPRQVDDANHAMRFELLRRLDNFAARDENEEQTNTPL